ncbi:hypothetical protein Godav_012954 [Gossypium davidsonii]|uniref:Uncharacterized protein n=2 Tax=Gossypium TaxID=3633 RepID=A0A7J8RES7_GOSDV|nr:hypothetical protein [Gossypium davidsonii]MBA0647485.1 hypothetical protein [Gossypium klotzschianum]
MDGRAGYRGVLWDEKGVVSALFQVTVQWGFWKWWY